MEFKIKERVLRPLNVASAPGQYIHEHITIKNGPRDITVTCALCRFRGIEFHAPKHTTVFLRALISRTQDDKHREYAVLWYISSVRMQVYINLINPELSPGTDGDQIFLKIEDEQEFREIRQFVAEHHLDRIGVGDEVPYVIEEDPLGFHRV